ncbi:hypothetical protein NW767_015383 [Fusarium falciforme]|uniref:AB hydrolase-1 domain-containing protein n=1 Tax=Fusarium falciforme TaxID=195108 RepID=A0A9W8QT52_9HYPO|nr:hypothetical protein NW755_014862 [Fusarium falciforme]KAJ4176629.1 hypothetical protein NW767_015383 [Fusarium falciforme]KAJ4177424.1 hypothetical protein NW759_017432 [Fusarium solani]KAJ4218829.1 hypothetical protein NW757_014573 [Fusarium falciforme]
MKPLLLLTNFLSVVHAASFKSKDTYSRTGLVTTQDGVRLNYTQSGPPLGQKILFIPGWRQTAAEWKKQVAYFSSAGYHVTTYDMRGHGESEKPDFGYRISRFAADLNDLLTQLDLTEVSIVAHSMGSSISWAWWDQHPGARKRISHFIFVDQSSVLTADPHWTEEQSKQVSALFTPIGVYDLANNVTAATPPFVRSMFTDSISEADFEWVLAENRKVSDKNAATLVIDHAFRDWRDVLPRINKKSLVIAGEVSINAAPGIAWVATQIPGGTAYTFTAAEKGSHFMFWENPDRFNGIVEAFIKS